MKADHSIPTMCAVLPVSPSGYYAWCQRRDHPGPRALAEQALAGQITTICAASWQTYGSPRGHQALRQQAHRHGRKRVARLMQAQGLCGRQQGRYRAQTTPSNHDQPIAPNQLATAAPPSGPNQIWVTDITFIGTGEGWLYLAAVLDLYRRKIVGWAMSHRSGTALVVQALVMARLNRRPPAKVICHSDRGVQYAAADYRHQLARMGAIASMSRKRNCYDNATMESFWSTLNGN